MIEFNKIPSPCYIMEEELLEQNLKKIKYVKDQAGVNIIIAFKAFALWKSFPIIRKYIEESTASSIYEAQLAYEEMGNMAHTFSPAYTEQNIDTFIKYSSHITFNSLTQFHKFYPHIASSAKQISCGLRINPEYSSVETDLYNPCAPGSRLGVLAENFPNELPIGLDGLHFHSLCESNSFDLEKTLQQVEEKFEAQLHLVKWLNLGGGHLITHKDYNIEHLIKVLLAFKKKYPNLEIIMEPGSAFVWQTGILISTIVDIVESKGIKTAILDVSFACHMPDCLEMPYKPHIRGAYHDPINSIPTYRMGGNSCLSGDFVGEWSFDEPLLIGDKIIFEDMMHYTTVKTTMFNGIPHPGIALWSKNNTLEMYREFQYEDYKNRMC